MSENLPAKFAARPSMTATMAEGVPVPGPAGASLAIQDEGVAVPAQPALNFTGAGVSVADDPANSRTNVVIAGGGAGSSIGSGTFANLPLDPLPAGPMVYYFSDSPYTHAVFDGEQWRLFRGGFECAPPNDADFTWVNQGTASVATTWGGVYLEMPGIGSQSVKIRKKSAPAVPYTISAGFLMNLHPLNYTFLSLGFRNSADGELSHLRYGFNNGWVFSRVNSSTPVQDVASAGTVSTDGLFNPIWLRIADNGVNHIFSYSHDGRVWLPIYSEPRATLLPASNEVFFSVDNRLSASYTVGVYLIHWAQS